MMKRPSNLALKPEVNFRRGKGSPDKENNHCKGTEIGMSCLRKRVSKQV